MTAAGTLTKAAQTSHGAAPRQTATPAAMIRTDAASRARVNRRRRAAGPWAVRATSTGAGSRKIAAATCLATERGAGGNNIELPPSAPLLVRGPQQQWLCELDPSQSSFLDADVPGREQPTGDVEAAAGMPGEAKAPVGQGVTADRQPRDED